MAGKIMSVDDYDLDLYYTKIYFSDEHVIYNNEELYHKWNENEEWNQFIKKIKLDKFNRIIHCKCYELAKSIAMDLNGSSILPTSNGYSVDTRECIELGVFLESFKKLESASDEYIIENDLSYEKKRAMLTLLYFFLIEESQNEIEIEEATTLHLGHPENLIQFRKEFDIAKPNKNALRQMLFVASLITHCRIIENCMNESRKSKLELIFCDETSIPYSNKKNTPKNALSSILICGAEKNHFTKKFPGKDNWEAVYFDIKITSDLVMASFDTLTLNHLYGHIDLNIKDYAKFFNGNAELISLAMKVIEKFLYVPTSKNNIDEAKRISIDKIMKFNRLKCSIDIIEWLRREFEIIKLMIIDKHQKGRIDVSVKKSIAWELYISRFRYC